MVYLRETFENSYSSFNPVTNNLDFRWTLTLKKTHAFTDCGCLEGMWVLERNHYTIFGGWPLRDGRRNSRFFWGWIGLFFLFFLFRSLSSGPSSLLQEYVLFTFLFLSSSCFFVYDKFCFGSLMEMGFWSLFVLVVFSLRLPWPFLIAFCYYFFLWN